MPLPPMNVPPPGYPPAAVASYPLPGHARKRSFDPSLEDTAYPPNKLSAFNRLGGRGGRGGRGGFRGRGGRGGGGSRQLAVRNIPPSLNNIAHLNNHFAKFGNLVNLQVQFEGDPASALVTFTSPDEAEMAFSSAEAVLGNRFIKVYYHNPKPTIPPPSSLKTVKDRLGPKESGDKVKYEGDILTKTISNESEKTQEEKENEAKQKEDSKAAVSSL
jgi:hypothetical protein